MRPLRAVPLDAPADAFTTAAGAEARFAPKPPPASRSLGGSAKCPLAFVDAFKMFKQLKADYPKTNETVRPIFAVCFLILRTLYWPVVSYHFWRASLAHEGDALEVNTFLVVNVILSSLQAYWTKLIIEGLVKLLKGDPTADDVGKDN